MKTKITEAFAKIKAFYKIHPKRFWAGGVVIVGVIIFLATRSSGVIPTLVPVVRVDLKQTVLATGQVTSKTDIDLSFSTGGLVKSIPVSVGDKVTKGQVLATFDNRNEYAALLEAQGALKQAQASYQKVVDGASDEDVAVSQAAVDSAKANLDSVTQVQNTLVASAHRALLNADLTVKLISSATTTAPTVTGTYVGSDEGKYEITVINQNNGGYFTYSGVESGTGEVNTTGPSPLGTKGLYIQFPINITPTSVWQVLLPNTASNAYLVQYNAYQNALQNHDSAIATAQATLNQALANLNLKKAAARPADVDSADAGVLTAQAKVDAAQVAYDNTILRAQADGTIVHVDTKIGERVEAQKEVMVLQDITNLYVEANVNETSIAKVALDQPVTMTLDAFGPDVTFTGKVIHIDPSATTTDGIANYVIKASIDAGAMKNATNVGQINFKDAVRPGMNANMTITCVDKGSVVVVPKAAIVTKPDGTFAVNLVTDKLGKEYKSIPVTTGFQGDGNLVEITSGLTESDTIALVQN